MNAWVEAVRVASARAPPVDVLPEGRMDAWVEAVRVAHALTPLMGADVLALEGALRSMDRDATWVKGSEVITTWTELAAQPPIHRAGRRRFTDEELRAVFAAIDTNGDGDICVAELKAAIRTVDPNAADETVQRMLAFADADGDAQVSFEEFKEIILGGGVKEPSPRSRRPRLPRERDDMV